MSRILLLFLCAFMCSSTSFSQDTARIVAKSKTVPVSAEEAAKADQNAMDFIANTSKPGSYFSTLTFVGPKLWARINQFSEFKNIKQGNVTYKVPKFEADGSWRKTEDVMAKVLQEEKDFKNLAAYLETTYTISKGKLSAMNLTDKFISWQYFAKIEEGIRVIEINSSRIMLHFTEGKLFFVELSAE